MITAVDTNVLIDVLTADAKFGPMSAEAIRASLARGSLVACDVVFAETAAIFGNTRLASAALEKLGLAFSATDREVSLSAASAWRSYRARGGRRERIAADFLIGAHALAVADRLLTRDRGFYRSYFRALKVLDPTNE